MYYEAITHCSNAQNLLAEIPEEYAVLDENGNKVAVRLDKSHSKRSGNETVKFVMVDDAGLAMLQGLTSLKILAFVECGMDVMAQLDLDVQAAAIFDAINDQTPFNDGNGNMITPARKFSGF